MSNSSHQNTISTIAGEPVHDLSIKPVPPLDGTPPTISRDENIEQSPKKRTMLRVQSVIIIIALLLSAYSFVVINSLDNSNSQSGADIAEVLVRTEGREADHICTEGGADIFIGNDNNQNGVLEEHEVTSTTRLCHGKEGLSGPQGAPGPNGGNGIDSLVNTTIIELGNETCFHGGVLITTGQDINQNGTLDFDEITNSEIICNGMIGSDGFNGTNGVSGHSALIERLTPPPHLCNEGFIINFGIDDGSGQGIADDGLMHDDEIVESLKICSQPLNYGAISDFFPGFSDGYSNQCSEFAWSSIHNMAITTGSDSTSGCELWISQGTLSTTQQLMDINPGIADSSPGLHLGFTPIVVEGEELWLFDADSGVNGRELWVSDLSASGTMQLTGYSGDGINADASSELWMDGLIFTDSNHDIMWTDGLNLYPLFDAPFIASDAQLQLDVSQSKLSSHTDTAFVTDESGVWFSAIHDDIGFEMHHLTKEGAFTSWDLNVFEDSSPTAILGMGNSALLVADDGINGRQLVELQTSGAHNWLTSMSLQSNGNPPTSVGENLGLNLISNKIIFDAQITSVDPTIWAYDLANSTLTELSSIMVAPSERVAPVTLDNRLWFDCITASSAEELCVSDGTTAGTKMIHEFQTGMVSAEIRSLVAVDNHLLVIANGEENGQDTGHCLWSFDVNSLQSELVYDPWPGSGNNSQAGIYSELIGSNDVVLFVADDGVTGQELHMWSPLSLGQDWLIW